MGQRLENGSFVPSYDPKDDLKDDLKDGIKDVAKDILKKVSDRQGLILLLIKTNELITIKEMTQKVKVSEKTIKRELATLQELGILSREGGRKDGLWVILVPND